MRNVSRRPSDITTKLQDGFRKGYRQDLVAGADEDPNISHACYASPPCYMHEIDPTDRDAVPDAKAAISPDTEERS
jgi:hypothetical protein